MIALPHSKKRSHSLTFPKQRSPSHIPQKAITPPKPSSSKRSHLSHPKKRSHLQNPHYQKTIAPPKSSLSKRSRLHIPKQRSHFHTPKTIALSPPQTAIALSHFPKSDRPLTFPKKRSHFHLPKKRSHLPNPTQNDHPPSHSLKTIAPPTSPKSDCLSHSPKKRSHLQNPYSRKTIAPSPLILKRDRPLTSQQRSHSPDPKTAIALLQKNDRTCTSPNTIALPQTPKKRSPLPHPKKAITLPYLQKRSPSHIPKSNCVYSQIWNAP